MTRQQMVAGAVVLCALGVAAVPLLDSAGAGREEMRIHRVPAELAAAPVLTAAAAAGPVRSELAAEPEGDPFVLRQGGRAKVSIPEPPPPPLASPALPVLPLPEP